MSNEKKTNNLSAFLASRTGRKFFHMLYSFGASIVIIGALAKITHLPFGNVLLFIGMITEAIVFAISAFDVDQVEYEEETAQGGLTVIGGTGGVGLEDVDGQVAASTVVSGGSGRGSIVMGGGIIGGGGGVVAAAGGAPVTAIGGVAYNPENLSPEYVESMDSAAKGMEEFGKVMGSLNEVTQSLLGSYQKISESTQGVSENSEGFLDRIKALNDNVMNVNSVFEAQMKSVSDQMETVKYINASLERIRLLYDNTVMDSNAFKIENERMARQIQELNKVYARLLQAMNAGGGYGGGYNNNPGGGYNPGGYNPGGGYNPEI